MRMMILGAVACGVIVWSAVSMAQSTRDALPMGETGFTCYWGGRRRPSAAVRPRNAIRH
jgi:hypothetical protein